MILNIRKITEYLYVINERLYNLLNTYVYFIDMLYYNESKYMFYQPDLRQSYNSMIRIHLRLCLTVSIYVIW